MEGTKIKIYRDKELGKGAQASVLLGKKVETGEFVACKRISLAAIERDKYIMQDINNELKAL